MPGVYSITLGLYDKPRFPKCCVVCSQSSPNERIGVGDFMVSWFGFLTDIPEGWGGVRIPVHSRCKWRFRLRRWLVRLGYIALTGVLYWTFEEQLEAMIPLPARRIGTKIVLCVMLLPVAFIETFFPPRFDVTFYPETAEYEFVDALLAFEFRRLNHKNIRQ